MIAQMRQHSRVELLLDVTKFPRWLQVFIGTVLCLVVLAADVYCMIRSDVDVSIRFKRKIVTFLRQLRSSSMECHWMVL